MLDHLIQFDKYLLHFINYGLGNPFFDWLLPVLRNPWFWTPLYIFIIIFCIWKYKKQGIIIIVLLALSAGVADFTSVHLGKNVFKRLRPCYDPVVSQKDVIRVPCGGIYGFPSTHATDHFAVAAFLSFVFIRKWRKVRIVTFFWAGLICFAQVYVGKHFPFDVIFGAFYGIFVGWLIYLIFKKLQPDF
jgi:membrane-associated phospholipid phosphatase